MTITQTVDIPANHRLIIDVPPEIPEGRTVLAFTPASDQKTDASQRKTAKSLASLFGIDKELDTMDAYYIRKRTDRAMEDAQIAKYTGINISPENKGL